MKRNPAGGLMVPKPGGYQRDAGALFGIPRQMEGHQHDFVLPGYILYQQHMPKVMRCLVCNMSRREVAEKEGA